MNLFKTFTATAAVITCCIGNPLPAEATSLCNELKGATVVAQDGTYLGKMESPVSPDSIFNKYGIHGSRYSSNSIWNKYGQYGGKYSMNSPFNKYSPTPPTIYTKTNKTAKLTINDYLSYTVNPYTARACFV